MTDHIDWDRLARYVSGESGATERAEIERWADAGAENRAALAAAQRRWAGAVDRSAWNVDAAWMRLAPRLKDVTQERDIIDIGAAATRRRTPWRVAARWMPLVAAAGLLLAIGLRFRDDTDPSVATRPDVTTRFQTANGEQRTIDLADGSQVMLGAASSLRLGEGFGDRSREVFLEGQAFLRVRHDDARPFVVNAAGTRTVDLGTAFEVRAYPNEGVRVAVTEGKVEVQRQAGASDSAVLEPGDVAELPVTGQAVIKRQQDVERLLGWTRGELAFEDAPLSEVARELERWFDVRVRFEDAALRDLHFRVTLRIGESLDELLKLVELSLSSHRVRAERAGNDITFRRGTPANPSAVPAASRNRVEAGA